MQIDEAWAAQVVRQYANLVYRLAFAQTHNREDAQDVFQEVFLRYFRKNPDLQNAEHRKAWLIRVTVNCARKHHRANAKQTVRPVPEPWAYDPFPENEELLKALGSMKAHYRAVIHLFYYEDCSVEQISKILGKNPSTIRAQLTRARKKLKELLKGEVIL